MERQIFKTSKKIRQIGLNGILIGGDTSVSLTEENTSKTVFALEIPVFKTENVSPVLKEFYGKEHDFEKLFDFAQKSSADIICLSFNLPENNIDEEIELSAEIAEKYSEKSEKPIMIKGSENKQTDVLLLPKIAKAVGKRVIIAYADENTYEKIVPEVIKNNHIMVLRSPIDINLAKELNILTSDIGLNLDNIIIDTDIGALGYGLDYGFSIIEKIRLAAFEGDEMLNMPIVSFIGSETYKTKETKTSAFPPSWGKYESRAVMWEIAAVSAVISAGADLVVCSNPKTIDTLKEVLWN